MSKERYDEKEKEYMSFSFDNEKNKSLLKEYYSKKKKRLRNFWKNIYKEKE
ncbi:hypothetical protein V3433_11390 [Fusobacterium polymorphum]